VYNYVLRMKKEQREEVRDRLPRELFEQDIVFTADEFQSARPLWELSQKELRRIMKDRLRHLNDEDVPDGHELEDKEHVRLIIDWDSDKVVFDDEVEVPKPERDRRGRDRARRRF